MLKTGKLIFAKSILLLFNSFFNNSIYPTMWICDILSPLHKKGEKSNPNNFRGILVSLVLKIKFYRYWLDFINETKAKDDQLDQNKLRTYRSYKSSFSREPYVDFVRNRNQ